MTLPISEGKGGCTFWVHVVPRSGRDALVGEHGDALKVKLRVAPEKGKANRALVRYLADLLGVASSAVTVAAGHTSRRKRVRVTGVTAGQIRRLLEDAGSA